MRKVVIFILPFVGIFLCFSGLSSIYGETRIPVVDNNDYIWRAITSAITGAVITSSSLFFFIRRIIH